MPPRRRPPPTTTPSTSTPRPSKLAKSHNLTALQESEIHEAFTLFSEPLPPNNPNEDQQQQQPHNVIPTPDIRRALIALGIPPHSPAHLAELTSVLDPDGEGFATYEAFVGVCALLMEVRRFRAEEEGDGDGEGHRGEVDEAFGLFTAAGGCGGGSGSGGGGGGDGGEGEGEAEVITLGDLRRVAALLRLDAKGQGREGDGGGKGGKGKGDGLVVTDELLRDMILEANGGAGVGRGVRKEEFDAVLRRAGVWR